MIKSPKRIHSTPTTATKVLAGRDSTLFFKNQIRPVSGGVGEDKGVIETVGISV